ncbi:hypothetical protein B0J17DRAFT_640233 [Rhizoctonia solani]|nr:hypothetical protein B0J17DRAFT_640233 [Rhizoctonia solani]
MSSTRSTTGCFACKSKHKKCDETKPHCLRCQKSRIECPGYTYIQDLNRPNRRPRTLPGPRTRVGQSQVTALQHTPFAKTEEPDLQVQVQGQLPPGYDLVTSQTSYNPVVANAGTFLETINASNQRVLSSSSNRLLQDSSNNLGASHRVTVDTAPPPHMVLATPMAAGQASLLEAMFSLGQPPGRVSPPRPLQPYTDSNAPLISKWLQPNSDKQDNPTTRDGEDPGGAANVIRHELVLDKTAESNALPFVLQAYATWIRRLAFDPLKLTDIAREFVFSHFEDGEQSRWIIALLSNIGSRVGSEESVEGEHSPLLSMLQTAVRRRLGDVRSRPHPRRSELVRALNSALEAIVMHFYTTPPNEAIALIQEATPIFRQLCPEPPGEPIDLRSLLQHPMCCLPRYAQMDITSSLATDMPTTFRYEITIPNSQPSNSSRLVPAIQNDGVIQWLHGIPNEILLLLAKMKNMRQDGLAPNREMVALLEQEICKLQPFSGSSSERFLNIMRSVVQECWRQAAYVYLYMAVCGDPCDTPRVKEAFKRYMKLLNGTKPGQLPDRYLVPTLPLICPAALQKRDREMIRQRALSLYNHDRTHIANNYFTYVIEDYWARADTERRLVTWSDVAVSRRRVLGAYLDGT